MKTLIRSVVAPEFIREPVRELQQKASEYWFGLSYRERQLVSLTGGLLVIWVMVFGVIRPVQNYQQVAQERLVSSQKLYKDVIDKAERIVLLKASTANNLTSGSNQALDILVNKTAAKAGITVTGLNRQQDSLQIRLGNVAFSDLVQWLTLLEGEGVDISTLQLARTEKPGVVEIQQLRVNKESL